MLTVQGGNCPGGQLPRGTAIQGDNCPGGQLFRGTSVQGGQLSKGTTVQGDNYSGGQLSRGATIQGDNYPGNNCPGGKLSKGYSSMMPVVKDIKCPVQGSQLSVNLFFYNFKLKHCNTLAANFRSVSSSITCVSKIKKYKKKGESFK